MSHGRCEGVGEAFRISRRASTRSVKGRMLGSLEMARDSYQYLCQHQRAIQDFDAAIRLNPKFAFAHTNRALSYTSLGKDAEAQQDVEQAVALGFDRAVLENAIKDIKKQR